MKALRIIFGLFILLLSSNLVYLKQPLLDNQEVQEARLWGQKYINMSQIGFNRIVGFIFILVAILHFLRASLNLKLTINGGEIPIWASYLAAVILLYLSYVAITPKK